MIASGSRTVNVDPLPAVLRTVIVPPMSSQNCLQIVSPSPVPPYLRVVELSACENGSKT